MISWYNSDNNYMQAKHEYTGTNKCWQPCNIWNALWFQADLCFVDLHIYLTNQIKKNNQTIWKYSI